MIDWLSRRTTFLLYSHHISQHLFETMETSFNDLCDWVVVDHSLEIDTTGLQNDQTIYFGQFVNEIRFNLWNKRFN